MRYQIFEYAGSFYHLVWSPTAMKYFWERPGEERAESRERYYTRSQAEQELYAGNVEWEIT